MLVKDCMTRHPIMISSSTPIIEAQQIMVDNKVRHLPVVGDGKRLHGLITRERLRLKPDTMGSLNLWEITRYISNLTVKEVMLKPKDVQITDPDKTVERAARTLMENQIDCLPVIEDGVVIGILTETDLMESLQEMLGLPAQGVRVTMRMPNQRGEFAKLTTVVAEQEWGIMGIGSFPSPRRPGFYDVVLKIPEVTLIEVQAILSQVPNQEIIDLREVV